MPSLKDISKKCGVSVATVSKALNNQSDISEETRERVRKVAKELGYFPNFSARALKTNRTHGIGVLFADKANSGLRHDYFACVLDSFKRTAEDFGYDITFINCSKKQPNRMSYLDHSRYHNFDGVILACIDFSEPEVIELVQSDLPVVTIDHLFNDRIAVISDNVQGVSDIMEYVIGMGHRKIAYIHGAPSGVTSGRLSGFFRTAEKHGVSIPDEYIKEAAYRNTEMAYERTKELLELKEPPTVILYPDDVAALGGMNAIREKGLRIPEDISIVGYDGLDIMKRLEPQISTLDQDMESMGRIAAERLVSLIEKPRTTIIEQVIVPGKLCEGRTVMKIN